MEAKLWNDKRVRDMYDNFGELYAIIKATEKLEKAYIHDIIGPSEYEVECQKLITHYRTLASTLKDAIPSTGAVCRHVRDGLPRRDQPPGGVGSASHSGAPGGRCCISCQLCSRSGGVCAELHYRDGFVEAEHGGSGPRMKEWLPKLSRMGAANELTEHQYRQLHFDLESSYDSFTSALSSAGT